MSENTTATHRWDVTLTHRTTREKRYTFTYAPTRGEAVARMREQFAKERPTWEGWMYRVATLPADLIITIDQVRAAREWLADCEWADVYREDFATLPPRTVAYGVQRHYEGGWAQFVADMA